MRSTNKHSEEEVDRPRMFPSRVRKQKERSNKWRTAVSGSHKTYCTFWSIEGVCEARRLTRFQQGGREQSNSLTVCLTGFAREAIFGLYMFQGEA